MSPSILKTVALIALVVALAPSLLYFFNVVSLDTMKWIMLAGTIAWFAFGTPWLAANDTKSA
ncbi:MAG: hypothetical protein AAFN77_12490 [Planctomycetota bacterium]